MASSWVPVPQDSDFTLANIPFGVARRAAGGDQAPFACTAIGAHVLDLAALAAAGLLGGGGGGDAQGDAIAAALRQPLLNDFMALGRPAWRRVRARLQALLRDGGAEGGEGSAQLPAADGALRGDAALVARALLPASAVAMQLPARVGDYTDFYSSRDHAYNVGVMLRGAANALQPNYLWLPVGYHGRSSSVVVSGTPFRRPCGQMQADPADPAKGAVYGASKRMDFELEIGAWVGPGNALGEPVDVADADSHVFGLCLMNDWSARDIQPWEYVPLGPFTAKNFCTTVSPWIVTLEALAPFRCATSAGAQDPPPLAYLADPDYGSYDLPLEVAIRPQGAAPADETVVCRSNYRYMYWNLRQQIAHHTVSGCNLQPGDLLGSGTISGPAEGERGSMLELSWKGERPLTLKGGEKRAFLADGDEVVLRGASGVGAARVGFGECSGVILPAKPRAAAAAPAPAPAPAPAATS